MSLFLSNDFLFKVQLFPPMLFTLLIDFKSLPIVHGVLMSQESPAAHLSTMAGEVRVVFSSCFFIDLLLWGLLTLLFYRVS